MRRQQLVDLAKAYEIPLSDPDAPKPKILPIMVNAMDSGVFRQPPKHDYYFRKASRSSDDPPIDLGPPPAAAPQMESAPSVERISARKPSEWNLLQKRAGALGIKIHGLKRAELEAAIHERESGESLRESQGDGQGEAGRREPLADA